MTFQKNVHSTTQVSIDTDDDLPLFDKLVESQIHQNQIEKFSIDMDFISGEAFFTIYPDFPLFSSSWLPEEEWKKIPVTKAAVMRACVSELDFVSIFETLHNCFHDKKTPIERENHIRDVEKSDEDIMNRLELLDQKGETMTELELQEYSELRCYSKYVIWSSDPWQEWELATYGVFMSVIDDIKLNGKSHFHEMTV